MGAAPIVSFADSCQEGFSSKSIISPIRRLGSSSFVVFSQPPSALLAKSLTSGAARKRRDARWRLLAQPPGIRRKDFDATAFCSVSSGPIWRQISPFVKGKAAIRESRAKKAQNPIVVYGGIRRVWIRRGRRVQDGELRASEPQSFGVAQGLEIGREGAPIAQGPLPGHRPRRHRRALWRHARV